MTMSLRRRLLWGMIISTTLLLGMLCIILYIVTRSTLLSQFDTSLLSTAKMLSATIGNETFEGRGEGEHHEEGTERPFDRSDGERTDEGIPRATSEFNSLNDGYYQVWNHNRSRTVRSPSLGKRDLPHFVDDSSSEIYRRCLLPGDKPGRVISYRFSAQREERHRDDDYFVWLSVAMQVNSTSFSASSGGCF
jgi:hypothetical protein